MDGVGDIHTFTHACIDVCGIPPRETGSTRSLILRSPTCTHTCRRSHVRCCKPFPHKVNRLPTSFKLRFFRFTNDQLEVTFRCCLRQQREAKGPSLAPTPLIRSWNPHLFIPVLFHLIFFLPELGWPARICLLQYFPLYYFYTHSVKLLEANTR